MKLGSLNMGIYNGKPIQIFFCYAHQDEAMRNHLGKHLRSMQHEGLIDTWHDGKINAGLVWEREVNTHLNAAQIILLLISPNFFASEFCYSIQMKRALERHEKKEALVIPILLRSVDLENTPFENLKSLPSNAKFVTRWRNRDDAFTDIARGIRKAVKSLAKSSLKGTQGALYCVNCGSPGFLPTPCWKCGLLAIQVCTACLEKNPINRDNCQKCDAPLVLICNHCKAKNSFEADFCEKCGLLLKLTCHECKEHNPIDRKNCQKCGFLLTQKCGHCFQDNPLDQDFCWRCGMPLTQICLSCGAFNEVEANICWRCSEELDIVYDLEIPMHLAKVLSAKLH